jgi:hypothetical protein
MSARAYRQLDGYGDSSMPTTRRDFFKAAPVGAVGATVFGFDLNPAYAQVKE